MCLVRSTLGAWTIERCVAISFMSKMGWSPQRYDVTHTVAQYAAPLCGPDSRLADCALRTHRLPGNHAPTKRGMSQTRKLTAKKETEQSEHCEKPSQRCQKPMPDPGWCPWPLTLAAVAPGLGRARGQSYRCFRTWPLALTSCWP